MGFFSGLKKVLDPRTPFRDPKRALEIGIDPAGGIIRGARGIKASGRNLWDPGGFFPKQQQSQQTPFQGSTTPHKLSPGAQALYDQMKARTAARMAASGQAQQPVVQPQQQQSAMSHLVGRVMSSPKTPPMQQIVGQAVAQRRQPMPYDPGMGRQMLADGGVVGDEPEDVYYESKAFERKPNGKPY